MKKYLFILGFAGMALFSACSTSDDFVAEKPVETSPAEQAIIVEAGQNSDVPINLGISQSRGVTRTPINSSDVVGGYGNFTTEDGRYLGVFCLATGTQTGASNIPTAVASNHWSADANGELGGLLVKLKDVPAKVTKSSSTYSFKFWRISTENEEHYYYPMSNWMKYNFYAYYPQYNSSTIEINEDESQKSKVEVTGYEIDGSQDLIWGMSDQENQASVEADPYGAKYFRLARQAAGGGDISAYYPKFKFKHQLVLFHFFVKAVDSDALDLLGDTHAQAKIKDMYIDNAISKLKFCVASQAEGFNDCHLTMDGDPTKLGIKKKSTNVDLFNGSTTMRIKSCDDDVAHYDLTHGYMGYLILPSPALSNVEGFKYRLVMKIGYDGSTNTDEVGVDLTPPSEGFIAGKSYNIIVRVQSPEEIFATAVLKEWDAYEDNSHNPYIEYEVE